MKCSDISGSIIDYLLEELAPELEIQMHEHLAICEKCRNELGQMEAVIDRIRFAERFRPMSEIYPKIMDQVKPRRGERKWFFGISRNLIYALGAFGLGILITSSVDAFLSRARQPERFEVRPQVPSKEPFSDTVEFYAVPAKNLIRT